jgi:hypothetical protein
MILSPPDLTQWTSNARLALPSVVVCALVLAWIERAAQPGQKLRADPWRYARLALAERKLRRRGRRATPRQA